MRRSPSLIAFRAGVAAALLGMLGLACAQTDIAGPKQAPVEAFTLGIAPGFLKCRPMAAANASKYVSPGVWDTLRVGPHKLIFQPGSLSQRTLITAAISPTRPAR